MMLNGRRFLFAALGCGVVLAPLAGLGAQQLASPSDSVQPTQSQEVDPLKRERSDQEKKNARKAVREELKGAYKTWLNDEVTYIISDEERKAFKNLSNDEERDSFIEQFWLRRNPNSESPENEAREEHYRRIAYANDHFAAGKPGWKTDRGHIYISFGPPDSIESHSSLGPEEKPASEGGGMTNTFPHEVWHYRNLEGIGSNLDLEFVDSCLCGDYAFTTDPNEKNAFQHTGMEKNANKTQLQQQDENNKAGGNPNPAKDPHSPSESQRQSKEFDRLDLEAKIFAPPPIKFKDLESFISDHKLLSGPIFPFDVRTDFIKVTESMVLVPITIQIKNRDITFVTKNGVSKGSVNILGKVTTIMHKTVQTFEDTVTVEQPAELLEKTLDSRKIYWKALPVVPGHYRLDIAIKDVNNPDHAGVYGRALEVPGFNDEKLATSTLILADEMNEVSSHQIGSGSCILGNTHICPRVTPNAATLINFKRGQQLNFWMQVYNLGIDEATKSNNATVTYQIIDSASNAVVFEKKMDSKDLGAHSDQLTVQKTLPLAGLQPGKYKVSIKINDAILKQEIAQTVPFVVE